MASNEFFIENGKFSEKIEKLTKRIPKLNEGKMTKMMENQNNSIHRSGLPVELTIELFSSLLLQNAFDLVAKMRNGLLAKNVVKMLKCIKMAMKGNLWNTSDCTTNLIISEEGLALDYSGPVGFNQVVLAILPIPDLMTKKPLISFYFEVEILTKGFTNIGFCPKQFPLEGKWLGLGNNTSIGIWHKRAMYINGHKIEFENENGFGRFKERDVIGLGIIRYPANSSMKCFVTCNGDLLANVELPSNFSIEELFPAIYLPWGGLSINTNFGKKEWRFNKFNKLLQ